MASDKNLEEHDYIVRSPGKIIRVRNGVETAMTEDEYNKENPEHRNSGCKKCSFAQDLDFIRLFMVPRESREQATERPKFVGFYCMPCWTGHASFYVFRCENCQEVRVDYPHGYNIYGRLYLRCDLCRQTLILEPGTYGDIYAREEVVAPPLNPDEIERQLREIVEKVEARGVKVFIPGITPSKSHWLKRIFRLKP